MASFGHLLEDITEVAQGLQSVFFKFVSKQCNRAANALAKMAAVYGDRMIWLEEIPPGITHQILSDVNLFEQ
jgi:hypothetical protein